MILLRYLYDSLDRTKEVRYPAQYGLSGSPRVNDEVYWDKNAVIKPAKSDDFGEGKIEPRIRNRRIMQFLSQMHTDKYEIKTKR